MKKSTQKKAGWPSWQLRSNTVEAWVTETGGQLAPVTFNRNDRPLQPYHVAPWVEERLTDAPMVVQVLRGDFFCMPFGGNGTPFKGEKHPVHGETASAKWRLEELTADSSGQTLHLSLATKVRKGKVDKYIRVCQGQNVVYSRHVVSGYSGKMPLGHHATLRFPDVPGSALLSFSPFVHGQVYPQPTEKPEERGYSILKPGGLFQKLDRVPMITGDLADLSKYPARRGFEDIAILVTDPKLDFAWSAASVPQEGYVWFALKDPRTLASTLLWMSNGGRHYPPWNGRHVNVLGIEELTSHFHEGLAESVQPNCLSRKGIPTCLTLSAKKPTTVNYIMGCVPAPKNFGRVKNITRTKEGVRLHGQKGTISTAVDLGWLSQDLL